MKAAIYCRVSTKRQTVDNQIPDLERYATQKGCEIVAIYSENETAWKRGHQHELDKCRLAARRHDFDVLFVWALDRLTRGGIPATFALINEFRNYGVQILSDNERFLEDIKDENTQHLWISLSAYIARGASDRNRDRINAGLDRARSQGKRLGRPPGKKDGAGVKRNRVNYILREERKREANNLAEKIERRELLKTDGK